MIRIRPRQRRRSRWPFPAGRRGSQGGITLVELLVCVAILGIMAAAILPIARVTVKRQKEIELRRALRQIRHAIDEYKKYSDAGLILRVGLDSEGYPEDLETLVEGVGLVGQVGKRVRFLRRIPMDPMTKSTEWGLRSIQDDPDSRSWGGQNVFDVYTTYQGTALDGSDYSDW